jgi:tetratricopeptide (TPR) repeat protein/tRNA A-37 threonylcarbamoyl transferase component Bud32
MSTDLNLLFGVLALQADFLDARQFAAACSEWAGRKDTPLADLLVERGWLTEEDRAHVEYLLQRRLKKHGGDAHASLAAVATPEVRSVLESVADADVRQSLADLPAPAGLASPATVPHETDARQRYTLTRLHAQGGIGQVWLAHDEDIGRDIALKELRPDRRDNPAAAARFLDEAKITGQLEHPGIVPVYELVQPREGQACYAMRFVGGRTLADAIKDYHRKRQAGEAGPLDLRGLLTAFVGVCNAVAYAHSRAVLHRDLKPQNVALGDFGEVLVLDWGLAKVIGKQEDPTSLLPVALGPADGTDRTQQGQVLGTPAYMAPEQARGRPDLVDKRSDVYGLGAILYEVLTGAPPFGGPDTPEVLRRVVQEPVLPPRQCVPTTPAALEAVCLKALAKKPEARYALAGDLARDVESWLADEPVAAWREPLRLRAGRWVRRHQTAVTATAAGVVVALLLGGGAAFLFERQWAERRAEQVRQEAQLRQGVEAALAEVARLQGQARWSEARAVLSQGGSRLGEGGPEDLRARVERARGDLDLVAWLDDIGLSKATVVEGKMHFARADPKYAAVFADAGLAKEGDDPGEVASRVQVSAVRGPLLAALDDWAAFTPDARRRAWLLEVARKADPNRWSDRARQRAIWGDRAALEELTAQEEAAEQSPQLVVALAVRLGLLGGNAVGLLRRAQAQHPDDFWLNFELGSQLSKNEPAEAAAYYRAALALRPDTAAVRNNLGNVLRDQGKGEEAEREYRAAIRLDPKLAAPHHGLGNVLYKQGKREEAEREYRAAIRLDPKDAAPHYGLGILLKGQGKREEAEREYRAAIRLGPKHAGPHYDLGNLLRAQGKGEEAEREYRAAILLDPKDAAPHHGLGEVLREQGKGEEAEREYRAAILLDPKLAAPHHGLGYLLSDQGRREEAEREYRAAIRLERKDSGPHNGLGNVLKDQGKPKEAEEEYRAAIRLDPKGALPHNGLGAVLYQQGRLEGAEREYRAAILLDPKLPYPHYNLGDLMRGRGRLEEANREYEQAVQLGLQAAQERLRQCDRLLALAPRLPAVLRGDDRPSNAQEMLGFADLCRQPFERRVAAAARLYGEAFDADAKVADDLRAGHRYNAACCAALAGCGQGKDADKLDDKEKARLRRHALDWLKADLALWAKQAQSGQSAHRVVVQQVLRHWKEDTDLAGVRGDALAKLPEAEREPWKKLWEEVDGVLAKVGASEKKQ